MDISERYTRHCQSGFYTGTILAFIQPGRDAMEVLKETMVDHAPEGERMVRIGGLRYERFASSYDRCVFLTDDGVHMIAQTFQLYPEQKQREPEMNMTVPIAGSRIMLRNRKYASVASGMVYGT